MSEVLRPKRFWTEVNVSEHADGWAVQLDARPVRTPDKNLLVVPTRALAEAVAVEWDAQKDVLDPERMPLTRAANVSIDRLGARHGDVVELLAEYGETDLLCYRADGPEGLVARQAEAWNPWLSWTEEALSARLHVAEGLMPVAQPAASLNALRQAVAAHDRFEIAGLHDLVTLSGSLVLGLAVSHGALDRDIAWSISRIDEDWQVEQWGEDAEAAEAAEAKRTGFLQAARLLDLLRES